MRLLQTGMRLTIERKDGYSTHGTFLSENEEYIKVRGTVGNNINKEIIVPKSNIAQIIGGESNV